MYFHVGRLHSLYNCTPLSVVCIEFMHVFCPETWTEDKPHGHRFYFPRDETILDLPDFHQSASATNAILSCVYSGDWLDKLEISDPTRKQLSTMLYSLMYLHTAAIQLRH